MTPAPHADARPADGQPTTAAMAAHDRERAPRYPPAPPPVPPDPAARDPHWPGQWPMRTHLELAGLLTAPGCARDHVSAVLREWRADADLTDTATLITSEILTNAVLSARAHGSPAPVRLWTLSDGENVLLMVWDATMPAPVTGTAANDAEHGRGLILVDALSARWGHYHPDRPPGGKVVWALLAAASPGPAALPPLSPA